MTDLGADELREAERLARDLFHELCPHCEDTPEKPWPIERSTTMRAFIAGYKAHAEKAQKKLRALEVKYNERGAAMQDTGDVVRSLYQGSEVSKRMTQLTLKLERAKAVLEQIDAEWCPHPGLRLDHNPHLNRDWCGSCTNWIRRGETNPAREALKELE